MVFSKNFMLNFTIQLTAMFLLLLFIVYFWMFVFINFLKYDYVMVSNVVFFVGIAYYIFNSLHLYSLLDADRRVPLPSMLTNLLLMAVLIYPLIFLAVFNVYEAWSTPVMSENVNLVGIYRSTLSVPVGILQAWTLSAGSYLEGLNTFGSYANRLLDMITKITSYPLVGSFLQTAFGFIVFRILSSLFSPKPQRENVGGMSEGQGA